MAIKRPLVIADSNKIARLAEEDSLPVDVSGVVSSTDLFLGDASAVTSAGNWDQVIEFDESRINKVQITGLQVIAPATLQDMPSGNTTVQISVDPNYATGETVTIGAAERSKRVELNYDVDVGNAEHLYIRFSDAGGHNAVSVRIEWRPTELATS